MSRHDQTVSFDELVREQDAADRRARRDRRGGGAGGGRDGAPAPDGTGHRGPLGRVASVVSGILLVLAVLATPLALTGWWAEHHLLDTQAFVDDNVGVVDDDQVRDAVAQKAAAAITDHVQLPEQARAILAPQVKQTVRQAIDQTLSSDTGRQTWQSVLAATHDTNVDRMRGTASTDATDTAGRIVIDVSPLLDPVRQALTALSANLGDALPDTTVTVAVGPDGALDRLAPAVQAVDRAADPLAIGTAAAILLGVLLAGRRLRALARTGVWLVVAAAVTFALARGGGWAVAQLLADQLGSAAEPLMTSLTMPLQVAATATGAIAAVVAIVARITDVLVRRAAASR